MEDLKGKVVLITGASSGIGAATALAFGKAGAHVAVHYRSNHNEANKVASAIRSAGARAGIFRADVCDTTEVDRLVADVHTEFGRIDVLINNAGGFVKRSPIVDA